MTREEWIQRYIAAMQAGGSECTAEQLESLAEASGRATEQRGRLDPDSWEDPEVIAEEALDAELGR